MRYFFLFLLLTSFAFTKTDRELLSGTWSLYELKNIEGEIIFSADKAMQQQLIDELTQEIMKNYESDDFDEKLIRNTVAEQLEAMEKMTFTFDDKGNAIVGSDDDDASNEIESTFVMDENRKQIGIRTGTEEVAYTYHFDGINTLTLRGQSEALMLIRKSH